MSLYGWGEITMGVALVVSGAFLLMFHKYIESRYTRMGGFGQNKSPRWVRVGVTLGGGVCLVVAGAVVVVGGVGTVPH